MSELAAAVLPLIRTRADLWRWSTANAHGAQMHDAVQLLRDAVDTEESATVLAVTQKAIASSMSELGWASAWFRWRTSAAFAG